MPRTIALNTTIEARARRSSQQGVRQFRAKRIRVHGGRLPVSRATGRAFNVCKLMAGE